MSQSRRLFCSCLCIVSFSLFACSDDPDSTEPDGPVASTMIDESGGEATSDDGMVTIDIPEGAVDEEIEVTIQRQTPLERDDLYTNLYEFGPSGVEFEEPVTVDFEYTDDPGDEELSFARVNSDDEPEFVPGPVFSENSLTGPIHSFSIYGGFAVTENDTMTDVCRDSCTYDARCQAFGDVGYDEFDFDDCVDECVEGVDADDEECVAAADAATRCAMTSLSCPVWFNDFAIDDNCADEMAASASACGGSGEIPDDPAFVADTDAEGPGGEAAFAFVINMHSVGFDSYETIEAAVERFILHTESGDEVEVEAGDVVVDFAAFEAGTDITVVWNVAIPADTYTEVEIELEPIEVIDDGDDITNSIEGQTPLWTISDEEGATVDADQAMQLSVTDLSLEDYNDGFRFEVRSGVGSFTGPAGAVLDPELYEND